MLAVRIHRPVTSGSDLLTSWPTDPQARLNRAGVKVFQSNSRGENMMLRILPTEQPVGHPPPPPLLAPPPHCLHFVSVTPPSNHTFISETDSMTTFYPWHGWRFRSSRFHIMFDKIWTVGNSVMSNIPVKQVRKSRHTYYMYWFIIHMKRCNMRSCFLAITHQMCCYKTIRTTLAAIQVLYGCISQSDCFVSILRASFMTRSVRLQVCNASGQCCITDRL